MMRIIILDSGPLGTAVMRLAAELWSEARRTGQPTADAKALDGVYFNLTNRDSSIIGYIIQQPAQEATFSLSVLFCPNSAFPPKRFYFNKSG
jgi:hypothetical protein